MQVLRPGRRNRAALRARAVAMALALIAVFAPAFRAQADADGPDVFRVTGVAADDVLNIRLEPDPGAPKIGEIPPNGDGIRNLGCQGGLSFAEWQAATPEQRAAAQRARWCRIAYGGVQGWVAGRFLAEGTAPAEPDSAPGSLAAAPGAASDYMSVKGMTGTLNVRAGPSTRAAIVAKILPGTLLRNSGCERSEGRHWCAIEIVDGTRRTGWAAEAFLEPAGAALRAGQGIFDAIGRLPCSAEGGKPEGACEYGVARDAGGSATIIVIRPDGTERALFFEGGGFVSADTSQADGYPAYGASRTGDVTEVQVGEERYAIPDAVLSGG